MSKRHAIGNGYFILYHQKNHEIKDFRFALSVPKKFGKAHERNLMKRRLREIVRMNSFISSTEFFLISRLKAKSLNFAEIKASVEDLFIKANLLEERVK